MCYRRSPAGSRRCSGYSTPVQVFPVTNLDMFARTLYAPSSLVFRWHDALVDSHMLMDIMSTRQKKYHQGKVIIPKAAVPILRLFDEDHESSESGHAVPVGSIRWTAREESLCCSFLQEQMQTSPNDEKDQLLRATSVYLVTEGYFRNPKRIYTHLWERARHLGSQGAYVSRTKKQDNLITSTWEALRASRTSLPQPLPPLVVSQAAESLVRQAYQDVNAASNGVHSWHQYRTHAHYLARFGTYDGDAKEIDMALLGLYETTSLKYRDTCGTRCIKAGQCRKCNPIKCVSCGGNIPSWLTECRRCNDKAKRPRGRTRSGADQNRCIDCGVAQNGKQRICPTCLLAMERRMEKENGSNADGNRRPRRFLRPEHQLGDRLCCDCKKPVPPERRRCQQCQEEFTTRRRVQDSELKRRTPTLDHSPSATVRFVFLARPDSLIVADEIPFASSCVSAEASRGRPSIVPYVAELYYRPAAVIFMPICLAC